MSRIVTFDASFSSQSEATRRAWSVEVRLFASFRVSLRLSVPGPHRSSIEPETRDLGGDGGGDEIVDGDAVRDELAHLRRRHRLRLDLEQRHTVGSFELSEGRVEPVARVSRARRDTQLGELEHAV